MTRALTCDASGGQGQAERNIVLVVTHLSQELKLQFAQNLSHTEMTYVFKHTLYVRPRINCDRVRCVTLLSGAVIMFM